MLPHERWLREHERWLREVVMALALLLWCLGGAGMGFLIYLLLRVVLGEAPGG